MSQSAVFGSFQASDVCVCVTVARFLVDRSWVGVPHRMQMRLIGRRAPLLQSLHMGFSTYVCKFSIAGPFGFLCCGDQFPLFLGLCNGVALLLSMIRVLAPRAS
jgi:hypothetical protein